MENKQNNQKNTTTTTTAPAEPKAPVSYADRRVVLTPKVGQPVEVTLRTANDETAIRRAAKSLKINLAELDAPPTVEVIARPKSTKSRSKYQAKERGLLTESNGFIRDAWGDSDIVTPKEQAILRVLITEDGQAEDEPISTMEVANRLEITSNKVAGAVSVMVAKGLVTTTTIKRPKKDGGNCRGLSITDKGLALV
jgi:DNA-binding MarR family transcriptional regulator